MTNWKVIGNQTTKIIPNHSNVLLKGQINSVWELDALLQSYFQRLWVFLQEILIWVEIR